MGKIRTNIYKFLQFISVNLSGVNGALEVTCASSPLSTMGSIPDLINFKGSCINFVIFRAHIVIMENVY